MSTAALILGTVSIILASASLFWNIYRDILLRPRTRVTSRISSIHHGGKTYGPYVDITLVNKGPGKVVIDNIVMKEACIKNLLARQPRFAVIIYDYENMYNPKMPTEVPIYEKTTQFLPYDKDSFLKQNPSRYGFIDSLGRYHWVRRRDLREVVQKYNKEFIANKVTG